MRRSFGLPWEIICHLVSFACFLVTFNRKKSLSARPTRHRRRVSMSACLDICFYFVCFRFSTSTASESFHFQPAPSPPPPDWLPISSSSYTLPMPSASYLISFHSIWTFTAIEVYAWPMVIIAHCIAARQGQGRGGGGVRCMTGLGCSSNGPKTVGGWRVYLHVQWNGLFVCATRGCGCGCWPFGPHITAQR